MSRHERHLGEIVEREQLGAQAVVDVMGVIGDVVGDARRPAPRRWRSSTAPDPAARVVVADGLRHAALAIAPDRRAVAIGERTVVLDQAFERLPGEVEPVEAGIAPLERGHHAQRLRVVIEAAAVGEAAVERALAGMAERRVAEVVGERERLGQILVEPERAGERAGDLGRPRACG